MGRDSTSQLIIRCSFAPFDHLIWCSFMGNNITSAFPYHFSLLFVLIFIFVFSTLLFLPSPHPLPFYTSNKHAHTLTLLSLFVISSVKYCKMLEKQRVNPYHLISPHKVSRNIRNFYILAYTDHGITTLSNSPICSNGIISSRLTGRQYFLDSTVDGHSMTFTQQ